MRQRGVLKDDRGMSFEEIGEELGVSWQRAAAICASAMTKFKAGLVARGVVKASDLLPDVDRGDDDGID